jgi:hypothetical protein
MTGEQIIAILGVPASDEKEYNRSQNFVIGDMTGLLFTAERFV